MATNNGTGAEKPAGGNKKPRDETIAKAAAAVVAGGIAWSLFRTVRQQVHTTQEHTTTSSISHEEKSLGAPEHKKGLDFSLWGSHKKQPIGNNTVIQVSAGDTLWGIARKHNVRLSLSLQSLIQGFQHMQHCPLSFIHFAATPCKNSNHECSIVID